MNFNIIAFIFLGLWFFPNIISFGLFGYDKHQATFKGWRIPEFILLLAAFFNGAFGALCGMVFFKHKTSKPLFLYLVPVLLFLQLIVSIICKSFLSIFENPLIW